MPPKASHYAHFCRVLDTADLPKPLPADGVRLSAVRRAVLRPRGRWRLSHALQSYALTPPVLKDASQNYRRNWTEILQAAGALCTCQNRVDSIDSVFTASLKLTSCSDRIRLEGFRPPGRSAQIFVFTQFV